MKIEPRTWRFLVCAVGAGLLTAAGVVAQDEVNPTQRVINTGQRQILNFNREWKFRLGDVPDAAAVAHDDKAWEAVGLPHSFSMPYFAAPDFYAGYGWYRKHLAMPQEWSGKRVNLEFDGAFQVTELFVNGRRIGEHRGGYNGFTFDITDALKPGDNLVAVRVNNLWDAKLAPRAGEHTFSGGIYRNVRVVGHSAASRRLVRHFRHHAAGIEGIRHGEREDGDRE